MDIRWDLVETRPELVRVLEKKEKRLIRPDLVKISCQFTIQLNRDKIWVKNQLTFIYIFGQNEIALIIIF